MAASPSHETLSDEQLRLGYRQVRTARWPDSFEAAMADPLCRPLIEIAARCLLRGQWHTQPLYRLPRPAIDKVHPSPARKAWLGGFDGKRAAANDLD